MAHLPASGSHKLVLRSAPEYNTSCFFITSRALPATGPPVRLTGEGCAHGRGHHCSHLIFAGQEEQAQISFFFFSGSGQGWREAYYMRVCCPCPSFTSSCKSKPRPVGNLATWCNQHQWAQIFGAAGSSISAPFDLRSRPLPFLSPAHLVSLALGKGRSREIKVQKRKSFQSWH